MAPPDDKDHDCDWRGYALHLKTDLEQVKAELAELKRRVFGRKSEKMPAMDREVRRGRKRDPSESLRKRRENALAKEKLVGEQVKVPVPEPDRACPHCKGRDLRPVGEGKTSTVYDYVPGYFRRRVTVRETLACPCGEYIVTAPCPDKTTDRTRYAPGFLAHIVYSKCSLSLPIYRLESSIRRSGSPSREAR